MSDAHAAILTILYDGLCPICRAGKQRLEQMDRSNRLRFIPLQDEAFLAAHPELDPAALQQSMHVLWPDGRTYHGADAFREIGRVIHRGTPAGFALWMFSVIAYLPGVLPLSRALYRQLASRRYQLLPNTAGHCVNGVCHLPASKPDR